MIDKLCVCGHAIEDRGAQTLEMNGSYLGSGLSTDYVDVKVFVCPWCGRMAFSSRKTCSGYVFAGPAPIRR